MSSKYKEALAKAVDENGPRPIRLTTSHFTKYFGYAGGKVLGEFPDKKTAQDAGAHLIEEVIDQDGYQEHSMKVSEFNKKVMEIYDASLKADYTHVPDEVYYLAYGKAYSDGHSYGMQEGEYKLDDYIDFALEVIHMTKKEI